MTISVPSGEEGRLSAQATMQFLSAHRCIRAEGVAERIRLPVDADGQGDARFQRAVALALQHARSRGVAKPIVMGAIPFDLSQPAYLTIPHRYEMSTRETLAAVDALDAQSAPSRPPAPMPALLSAHSVPEAARFKQAVQQVVANFQFSDIRKAVLSRMLELELAAPVDTAQVFARLMAQNSSGYHFRLPLADGAELVGASPELLVRTEGGRLYSNPLAGSAKRQGNAELDFQVSNALLQSGKDGYEHSLVIQDIERVLAPLCRALDVPPQPTLLSTAAMWHLSTRIEGELADPAMTALQLACRLHPTPAVCGYPTRLARKLIELVEPFERGMFSGMVGWCDGEGNGEWAVTIRCGRIQDKRIQLFAGAGIVADSCPESEWAETQAKLQTMLNAVGVALPPAAATTMTTTTVASAAANAVPTQRSEELA